MKKLTLLAVIGLTALPLSAYAQVDNNEGKLTSGVTTDGNKHVAPTTAPAKAKKTHKHATGTKKHHHAKKATGTSNSGTSGQ